MNFKLRETRTFIFSLACLAALLALSVGTVFALATAVVVDPTHMNGWSFAVEGAATVKGNLIPGPGTAPLGLGSAHLAVTDATGAGAVALKSAQFKGTLLNQIASITYSTYITSAAVVAPMFQMEVDFNGTDTGRLIFEPPAASILPAQWQQWTPLFFNWYGDSTPDGTCLQAAPCTWGTILGKWPTAKIVESDGEVLFKAGGALIWGNFDGNVDNFTFTTLDLTSTAFDFEPPADVYVDDDWAAVPPGTDPNADEDVLPNVMGLDAFTSIQEAIDVVQIGGNVYVAAGTYANSGQIIVHKTLSLVGEDRDTTILNPLTDATGGGDAGAWIVVNEGVTFNLSGVTLDGSGRQLVSGLRFNGGGVVDDVIIQHIKADGYMGFAIVEGYTNTAPRTLTVSNSTITDFGRVGIQADEGLGGSTTTITNNIITGKGEGDHLDYGVTVEGGATAVITGNTITNCMGVASVDGSTSGAIMATTYFAQGTTATITGNTLMNNSYGILVGYDEFDKSSVTASFNRIVKNGVGIASSAPVVAAENNWWGCNEGPAGLDCNPVDAVVDADPWLVMAVSALPSPLIPGTNFTFTADLTKNSNSADTSTLGYLPDGAMVAFTPIERVNPDEAGLASGTASTTASLPVTQATFDLCARFDAEQLCRSVVIAQPVITWADDAWVGLPVGTVVNWGSGDHIIGYDAFAAVQGAVTAVAVDGDVIVRPGTYLEQVSVTKSLSLSGEAGELLNTLLKPPAINPVSEILLLSGTGVKVEITGLTISGPGAGTSGSLGSGIFVRDGADANIHHNRIVDIRDSVLSSAQTGIAIQVGSQTLATTGSATIDQNTISGYQKTGIAVSQSGSTATITANTITGAGPTSVIAQRGILVSYGATANITGNAVNAHSYLGAGSTAIGILIYGANANTSANTLSENFYGIYHMGGSGTHDSNVLNTTAAGVGASLYYGISISNALAAAPMTVTVSNNDLNGNLAGYAGISVFGSITTSNITLTARNNYVRNWQQGIVSRCESDCTVSGYPSVVAEKNSITGSSTYALAVYTAPAVNAITNWWGSQTGPTHLSNAGGVGGAITDGVTYSPWLCSSTDTAPATGFQPDLTVKCGLPAKLVFSTQPGGALVNQALSPQPVIAAQDADGNPAINFSGNVTMAIGINPNTGTLAGGTVKAAVGGIATFTDLSIDRAGIGYALAASATGLTTTGNSTLFTINNPVPVLSSLSPTWARRGSEFAVVTLNGTGFVYNSQAKWGDTELAILEQSSTFIRVYVPGTLLTTLGTANITAINPTPGGGTSAAKVFSIVTETDISMTKTDGKTLAQGGETITYTLVVSNAGPDVLTGGTLSDPVPPLLTGVTWTCAATGTGSLCAASGSGSILDTVNIAVGGSLTYTITGSLPLDASGTMTNTATLTLPALYADTDGLGLTVTDTTLVGPTYISYLPSVMK